MYDDRNNNNLQINWKLNLTYQKILPKCHHLNPYRSYFWLLSPPKFTKINHISHRKTQFYHWERHKQFLKTMLKIYILIRRSPEPQPIDERTILTSLSYATAKARIRRNQPNRIMKSRPHRGKLLLLHFACRDEPNSKIV